MREPGEGEPAVPLQAGRQPRQKIKGRTNMPVMTRTFARITAAGFVVAALLCSGTPSKAVEKQPPAATPANKQPGVIAAVNGFEVPIADFYRELNRTERLVLESGAVLTCSRIGRLKNEVAEALVRRELLYQESRKKVQVSEAEINGDLNKLKQQYASESDFANALSIMKITPEALRTQVERALYIQKLVETQFVSQAAVTDKDIWAYYDRNRGSFRQPEQVRASHILIKVDPKWPEKRKAEARKKMEEILKKARAGEDFAALAQAYSEDASAAKGGDVGYIRAGQVLKPFEEALFTLKPGEISEVVETSLGYHVIKAADRKPEMTTPFENLKDELRRLLKLEKGQQEASNYAAKLREKAKVEVFLPSEE